MPDRQSAHSYIDFIVSQHETSAFVVHQFSAEHLAFGCIAGGDVMGAAGGAEPAHAVGEPRRREANLRVAEALAEFSQNVAGRNSQIVELHHGMTTGEGLVQT